MAIYTAKLTVPAGTPRDSPVSVSVDLAKAVLTRILVRIPPGHCAVTGLRILYGRLQLWPEERGTWLSGDDETLTWDEYFELPHDPTRLTIEGYNESTEYEHSFLIRFATLPKRIALWQLALSRFVEAFRKLTGIGWKT